MGQGDRGAISGAQVPRAPELRFDQFWHQDSERGWEPWPWARSIGQARPPSPSLESDELETDYSGRDLASLNGSPVRVAWGFLFRPGIVFEGDPTTAAEFLRELAARNGGYERATRLSFSPTNALRDRMMAMAQVGFLGQLFRTDTVLAFRNMTYVNVEAADPAPNGQPRIRVRYNAVPWPLLRFAHMSAGDGFPDPSAGFDFFRPDIPHPPSVGELQGIFNRALESTLMESHRDLSFDLYAPQVQPDAVADTLAQTLAMAAAAGDRAVRAAEDVIRGIRPRRPESLELLRGFLNVGVSVSASWAGDLGISFYFDQVDGVLALHGELVRSRDGISFEWETVTRGSAEAPAPEAVRAFLSALFAFEGQGSRGTPGPGGPSAGGTGSPSGGPSSQRFSGMAVVDGAAETTPAPVPDDEPAGSCADATLTTGARAPAAIFAAPAVQAPSPAGR